MLQCCCVLCVKTMACMYRNNISMKKTSTGKTMVMITVIMIVCKLLGFLRESLLAYYFGASYVVDAYLMAALIPPVVFGWLTSTSTVFTPMYMDVLVADGKEKANRFLSTILSDILLVCAACVLVGIFLSQPLVRLIAPGFEGETLALTVRYLRLSMWMVLFTAPINILMAYLECNGKYIQSQLSNLLISSTRALSVVAGGLFGEQYLILGILLCYVLQLLCLLGFTCRGDYALRWSFAITPKVKALCKLMLPVFIGSMITEVNTFVDKIFASMLTTGSIAMMNYALQIRNLLQYVFFMAINTVSYPLLAKEAAALDMDAFRLTMRRYMRPLLLLFVPLTIGAILLAEPAISFVYQQGQFTAENTQTTSSLFILYSLSLLPLVMRNYILRLFYALKKTKMATVIGAVTVGLNIVLNFALVGPMQARGLALATSTSTMLTSILALLLLRRQISHIGVRELAITALKTLVAGAIMGLVVYLLYGWLSTVLIGGKIRLLITLAVCVVSGAAVYGGMLLLLRVEEVKILVERVCRHFGKKQ